MAECKHWDVLFQRPCGATAPFDGYCGPHRRMVERAKLRAEDPSLTHWDAERLVRHFNLSEERHSIAEEARALRYVFPKLKYREAKEKVLASRRGGIANG